MRDVWFRVFIVMPFVINLYYPPYGMDEAPLPSTPTTSSRHRRFPKEYCTPILYSPLLEKPWSRACFGEPP